MQTIDIIARIIGPIYLIAGVAMLMTPDTYRRIIEDFMKSPALCYLGGLVTLIAGLLILTFHESWASPLAVIVGIIGWLALIKGAVLIVRPDALNGLSRALIGEGTGRLRLGGASAIVLGAYMESAACGLI